MTILLIFLLLLAHLIGDFSPLSTPWMLRAKHTGQPLLPILAHASVHGALMMLVLIFFANIKTVLLLVAFEIGTHFIIDVVKGKMNIWFPKLKEPSNYLHWSVFGIDQLLHQTVILLIVTFLIYYPF
jgi:hypothetical protein